MFYVLDIACGFTFFKGKSADIIIFRVKIFFYKIKNGEIPCLISCFAVLKFLY